MSSGGVVWALIANLLGGTSYVLGKLALEGLTPSVLVVVRSVVALAMLVPLVGMAPVRALLSSPGRDRRLLFAMGVGGYAMPLWLGNHGLQHSTAANAALLIGVEPLCVVVLGWLVLGERLTGRRVAALVAGLLGATVIVTDGVPFATRAYAPHVWGDLLLLASGAAWAVYTIAAKPLVGRCDPLVLATAALLVSVPPMLPAAWGELPDVARDARLLRALAWACALGVLVSGLMSVLWTRALQEIDATVMAAFICLQPLVGVLLGVVVLGEPLSAWVVVGGAMVVGGGYVIVRTSA